jgi:hypothetical protein
MWPKWILVAACLAVAACQHYSLVPKEKQTIGGTYSVDPQIEWSHASELGLDVWTVDGPILQAVRFMSGVKDGQALFQLPPQPGSEEAEKTMPLFRSDFSRSETVDFILASLERFGAAQPKASNIRPGDFGSAEGIRFEFTFLMENGLEADGIAAAAQIDEELYVILYTGAREYYFPKYKAEVERMIDSIEL